MKRLTHQCRVFLALAAFACAVNGTTRAEQAPVKRQTISLGIISEINRAQIAAHFSDFARYLAMKLSPTTDMEGKVVIAPTPFQLAKLIEQRQVDFYMESAYPTYLINDVHGAARLLLRRWKGGMPEYRSLIFTKRNDEIRRLEDLRGKLFVFEDPESTSGHFLPKFFLKQRGFKFTDKSRFDPAADPTDIGYRFVYSQEKLVDWVLSKRAAAGAFSDDDFTRLEENSRADIAILARTESLPRHFISVRKDLSSALADRAENVLLSMHQNDEGQRILKKTDDTTKFDRFPDGAAGLSRRLMEIFRSAETNH